MPAAATFNVGTIVGGTAGNILARECEVLWGYRELPGTSRSRSSASAPSNGWRTSCCPR